MANYSREIAHMLDRLYTKILSQDKNGYFKNDIALRLNLMELLIIKRVGEAETIRLSVLIDALEIDRNLVTQAIKKLCSLKLAHKSKDPEDGRGQCISLLPSGQALYGQILNHQKDELDFILSDVTINEEKTILKFISKIVQYHTEKFEIK